MIQDISHILIKNCITLDIMWYGTKINEIGSYHPLDCLYDIIYIILHYVDWLNLVYNIIIYQQKISNSILTFP